ncbi:hypothetical protein SNE40_022688 [Patella caerulea]|uniref:Uncharacterized protein n=1 Tax=Patella caerulea TaxID=87958 RepID=A0AAN8IXW5_PATCE
MEGFPTAIYLASEESVFHNQGVLFHLVRPTKKGDGVESAAGLANVIPRKRIYRMETVEELDLFKNELLKRPLVLQPTSESGKGLGYGETGCGLCINTVNWVLLINQTHPKILGRIQMGVDAAKAAMGREEPFLLRFKFGSLLERMHYDVFKDGLDLEDVIQLIHSKLRFANWQYGELIVRYPGPAGTSKRKKGVTDIQFKFEDIEVDEIDVKAPLPYAPPRPSNHPVQGDEIRNVLPGWTVNEVTPLENIGETAPQSNYSYAQAGRLYESFRKKKRQKPGDNFHSSTREGFENAIELDEVSPSVMGGAMAAPPSPRGASGYSNSYGASGYSASNNNAKLQRNNEYTDNRRGDKSYRNPRQQENASSLYPDVQIMGKTHNMYDNKDTESFQSLRINGTESERSSYSTAASSAGADSGYHGNESDAYYRDNHHNTEMQHKGAYDASVSMPRENLGFHHEDDADDDILAKHKEFVNKMLHNKSGQNQEKQLRPREHNSNGHLRGPQIHKGSSNGRALQGNNTNYIQSERTQQYQPRFQFGNEDMSESFI